MILLWSIFNKLQTCSKRAKVMGIMCYGKEVASAEDFMNVRDALRSCTAGRFVKYKGR